MIGGWFVGNFEPSAKKENFEVCYKQHKKNEKWETHYHKNATEINLLIKGNMKINETIIEEGDIFVIEPYYISKPEFLEDCSLIVVKTKSDKHDKYIVE
jgi:hypothetical protein